MILTDVEGMDCRCSVTLGELVAIDDGSGDTVSLLLSVA